MPPILAQGTKDQIALSTFHMVPSWCSLAFAMVAALDVAAFSGGAQNAVRPGATVELQPDDQSPYAGMSVKLRNRRLGRQMRTPSLIQNAAAA
jgi:hypothetical protein